MRLAIVDVVARESLYGLLAPAHRQLRNALYMGAVTSTLLLSCSRPQAPTADTVYATLVTGGCLGPDDGGAAAVAQEHALADQPAWLGCLFEGGTIAGCSVPCDATTVTVIPPEGAP